MERNAMLEATTGFISGRMVMFWERAVMGDMQTLTVAPTRAPQLDTTGILIRVPTGAVLGHQVPQLLPTNKNNIELRKEAPAARPPATNIKEHETTTPEQLP